MPRTVPPSLPPHRGRRARTAVSAVALAGVLVVLAGCASSPGTPLTSSACLTAADCPAETVTVSRGGTVRLDVPAAAAVTLSSNPPYDWRLRTVDGYWVIDIDDSAAPGRYVLTVSDAGTLGQIVVVVTG